MGHSNSSLNCFLECEKKYEISHINKIKPNMPVSPHLTFGAIAHEVLENAGILRDQVESHHDIEYFRIIPSEIEATELKDFFGISNWRNYFTPVVKQVAEYESQCIKEMQTIDPNAEINIERERRIEVGCVELERNGIMSTEPLVGVIDLLIRTEKYAIILDYKFSNKAKDQGDFDLNSQLPIYAYLVHKEYGVPLKNIQYGYIDIPKVESDHPVLLKNGRLSVSKSQNVPQDVYKKFVEAIHGNDPVYNCEPGGYYYETYSALANVKTAYLSKQWIDMEVFKEIYTCMGDVINVITKKIEEKEKFLKKMDAFSCKKCDYRDICKHMEV